MVIQERSKKHTAVRRRFLGRAKLWLGLLADDGDYLFCRRIDDQHLVVHQSVPIKPDRWNGFAETMIK
jgi:hypothetical protein